MSDRKPNIHQCDCPEQCATKPHKWRLWIMRYGDSRIAFDFTSWQDAMEYAERGNQ